MALQDFAATIYVGKSVCIYRLSVYQCALTHRPIAGADTVRLFYSILRVELTLLLDNRGIAYLLLRHGCGLS